VCICIFCVILKLYDLLFHPLIQYEETFRHSSQKVTELWVHILPSRQHISLMWHYQQTLFPIRSVPSSLVKCLQIWFCSNLMAMNKSDSYPIWHITAARGCGLVWKSEFGSSHSRSCISWTYIHSHRPPGQKQTYSFICQQNKHKIC